MYLYSLHGDWDYKIPDAWQFIWRDVAEKVLQDMGFKLKRIIIKPSPHRKEGKHLWLHIESPRKLSDDEVNMLQWLVVHDHNTRVWINMLRIDRGLKRWWNKLFSRHLWRKPLPERCQKCKLREILGEMREEYLKKCS